MRRVKVAAIQPAYLPIPAECRCLSDSYRNVPEEVMENHISKQMEVTFELMEKAGQEGCDIVCSCEDLAGTGSYIIDISESNIFSKLLDISYPVIESRLSEISQKYSMYIIGCYNKRIDGRNYNVASIFDRKGKIIGEYRKTHLPPDETWQITEGESINVFELDFGKIGISICYDMMFQEVARVQSLLGAEIIFHPTVGYGWYDEIGEATLRTRANDNGVYIVTSKNYSFNRAGKSSVVDFWGHVLAEAGYNKNVVVSREIDLDHKKAQPEWFTPSQMSGTTDVKKRMLKERRPELYQPICQPLHEKFVVPKKEEQMEIIRKVKSGKCHW